MDSRGFADGHITVAAFNNPGGLDYNPVSNNLFVGDQMARKIRSIDLFTRNTITVTGGGTTGYSGIDFCPQYVLCNGSNIIPRDYAQISSIRVLFMVFHLRD